MTGRAGALESPQAGSSLELHDFREYQPGDDLRHIDWNAVARTDRLIVRVRRDEVAPRVEIVVDASRSMAVTEAKRERTRELAAMFTRIARDQGLAPALHWIDDRPRRVDGEPPETLEGKLPLPAALARVALRPCGLRVLISDLLFEAPGAALQRLAAGTSLLGIAQVLDAEDESPTAAAGARLVDSESGEWLDRHVTDGLVARYLARLRAHHAAIEAEARRYRARVCRVSAAPGLEEAVRSGLAGTLLVARARN